jgi:holin-like protein
VSAPLAPAVRRPVVVTIAVVLVYLSGLASIAVGILILLSRYTVDPPQVLPVSLLGAGVILFGLLTIAVASGVSRGRRLARLLVTIYLVLQFVLRIVTILSADAWDWSSAIELAAYAFIAYALWAPPGSRFFAAAPADHVAAAPAD